MSSMTLPTQPTPTPSTTAGTGGGTGAACAVDPERMFPLQESQRPGERTEGERRALQVCAACPVLAACRRAVLDTLDSAPMPYGVAAGLTREDRRAVRAARRDLTGSAPARAGAVLTARLAAAAALGLAERPVTIGTDPDPAPAPAPAPASTADTDVVDEVDAVDSSGAGSGLVVVDELDEQLQTAIAAHPEVAGQVDPATVRALIEGRGPQWASRWEVALAAVVLLERGLTATAAARFLGEEYVQVKRWRDRSETGEPLVAGERGTVQLRRPARLVGPQVPATARPGREARTRGAA